jgi:hypothetical protein
MSEATDFVPMETKVFRSVKAGVTHMVSLDMLRDADLTVDARTIARHLVLKMEAHLLTDDVLTDERDVYAEGYATVTTQRIERYRQWGIIPRTRIVDVEVSAPVHGSAKVKAEYFATFPEIARGAYPGSFGTPRKLMQFKGEWLHGEGQA